jgi:hypothetical protein
MPCEQIQDALMDLAATSAQPDAALREHLAACASCRAVFEREQFLFASIDAGVRQSANAPIPSAFLQRLEARIAQEATPQRTQHWTWLYVAAFSTAALIVVLLPLLRPRNTAQRIASNATPRPRQNAAQEKSAPSRLANAAPTAPRVAKHSARPTATQNPEVLIPPDEREALARYISNISQDEPLASALLQPAPQSADEHPSIEPLQVALLDVKPLEEKAPEGESER